MHAGVSLVPFSQDRKGYHKLAPNQNERTI